MTEPDSEPRLAAALTTSSLLVLAFLLKLVLSRFSFKPMR